MHRPLGPGLLESMYRRCLMHEPACSGLFAESEQAVGVHYKGFDLDCGFRIDILVEKELVVELKSVDALIPIHAAQLLTDC